MLQAANFGIFTLLHVQLCCLYRVTFFINFFVRAFLKVLIIL